VTLTNVLIVAHGHPELSKGGAEIAAYGLFKALKRNPSCRPAFLAWRDDGPELQAREEFCAFEGREDEFVFHAVGFDRFRFSQRSEPVRAAFRRLLERLEIEVAHFHHYVHVGLELIAIARERGARVVVTLHEFLALCHNEGVMVRRTAELSLCDRADPVDCARCFPELGAERFVARKAFILEHLSLTDAYCAPSGFVRDRYVAWGLPGHKTRVIENGLETMVVPPRRRRSKGEGRNVFGYFGQIHPYKGLLQLLAAFVELAKDRETPARLVIHGAYLELNHPRYIEAFQQALAKCGSCVQFAGPYERDRLGELMGEVDWVVVPSIWWENAPYVIEEALACGRPVLCSNIGGMREKIREGIDGVWFPVGDPRALAATIRRLAREDRIWKRLRRTLRRPTSLDVSAAGYFALYQEILSGVIHARPDGQTEVSASR
jgi:glycosyltransferase involved in cell wall biosynthesis